MPRRRSSLVLPLLAAAVGALALVGAQSLVGGGPRPAPSAGEHTPAAGASAQREIASADISQSSGARGPRGPRGPRGRRGPQGRPGEAPRVASSLKPAAVSTTSDSYTDRGGPYVTVTVPPSGLVEVWAQATFSGDEGAIGLFRNGNFVRPQAEGFCGPDDGPRLKGAIMDFDPSAPPTGGAVTVSTGNAPGEFVASLPCGTAGPPQLLLVEAPRGRQTFSLRYAECSCGPPPARATFANRKLRVAARP